MEKNLLYYFFSTFLADSVCLKAQIHRSWGKKWQKGWRRPYLYFQQAQTPFFLTLNMFSDLLNSKASMKQSRNDINFANIGGSFGRVLESEPRHNRRALGGSLAVLINLLVLLIRNFLQHDFVEVHGLRITKWKTHKNIK